MAQKKSRAGSSGGQVRIIAGDWKGRRLNVLAVPGLRPTGDRVRETVFNWLQWELPGRRCLDLFAGTGALSFEALSRGASLATLIDADRSVCQQLRKTVAALGAEQRTRVYETGWDLFLSASDEMFDLVFVDPPFSEHLHRQVLQRLCAKVSEPGTSRLSKDALVYVEAPAGLDPESIRPTELKMVKASRLGDVTACLMELS
jgi:16S rRNA (guanine966-N2)-methyltransferase